ncbi:MAG: hypothetical protein ACI97A_001644 [Planctomycetota bacterium]|jgi:hypothetical protein
MAERCASSLVPMANAQKLQRFPKHVRILAVHTISEALEYSDQPMSYPRIVIALLASLCVFPLAAETAAQAPPGWRTFEHTQTGVKLFHNKEFKVTPVKPDEHLILGKFDRSKPYKAKKKDRNRRPESFIAFVLNDKTANDKKEKKPAPFTLGGGQPVGGKAKKKKNEIKNFSDYEKMKNDIHTWQEFLKKRYRGQLRTTPTTTRMRDGELEFRLHTVKPPRPIGFLYINKVEGQTYGVMGFCEPAQAKYFQRNYRKIGRSMEKPSGFVRVRDTSAKFYENKDLKGIPFRIKARRGMVKGWKAKDTANFFVLYHTPNTRLVNKIVNDLEAIQPHYAGMFAPVPGVDAVSVVRICQDVKEYMKYGGPPGSAGYWNHVHQELVFYDATKDSGSKSKRQAEKDSYIVLYHEGFHQYIFNGLAGVSPDYWFNEGMADYFSGSVFYTGSTRLKELGPNRWRIPRVKGTVDREDIWIPLERLIGAKRKQFYNPKLIGQMYAEAWSLAYFLLRSDEAEKHPGWREIIPVYYGTLKKEAARVKKLITKDMSLNAKQKLYAEAGTKATKIAFKQIDKVKLESAWMQWIRTLKDPWAAQRPKPRKRK